MNCAVMCVYTKRYEILKQNVMVEHSMQKSHIRQINDKECAPFHISHSAMQCNAMYTHKHKIKRIIFYGLFMIFPVILLLVVVTVAVYLLSSMHVCMYSKWLSPLLLCNRFVSIHHAIFLFFLWILFLFLCLYRCTKINGNRIQQQKKGNLRKKVHAKHNSECLCFYFGGQMK